MRMLRLAWATALVTLIVLTSKLTFLDPANQTLSCAQLELGFESEDFKNSLPKAPALIIGNQRVRYWDTPPSFSEDKVAVRRWMAGLNPNFINQCFTRLVGFYQPSLVIVPIDTTFAVNADQSAVLDALQGIIDQRSEYSLDFELWVIAPITTPRYQLTDKAFLEEVRAAGSEWAANESKAHWLDLQYTFIDQGGVPDSRLVWPDGNTLNEAGYQRLTDALVAISNGRK